MQTPAFASATNAGVTAAANVGVTVNAPASLANGDVLYAFVSKTTYASTAPFTCSGWTEITSGTRGYTTGNDTHLCILRKVITDAAGEPASYTFVTTSTTSSQMVGIIVRVTGANTTTPEDVAVPSVTNVQNDATPASRALTTTFPNSLVLQVVQLSLATTATKTMGAPSGYTLNANAQGTATSGSLDNQMAVAYKTQASPGAVGTNAWTNTADDATTDCVVCVVAIRGAADANTKTITGSITPSGSLGLPASMADSAVRRRWSLLTWSSEVPPGPTNGATTAGLRLWRTSQDPWWPAAVNYTSTLNGAVTPGPGAVAKQAQARKTGTVTPGPGAAVRQAQLVKTGGATPAGAIAKQAQKALAGALGVGKIVGTIVKLAQLVKAGTVTPPGAPAKQTSKPAAGSAGAPSGALVKQAQLPKAGAVTPGPGTIARVKSALRTFTGSITPSAVLTRLTAKVVDGDIAPSLRVLAEYRTGDDAEFSIYSGRSAAQTFQVPAEAEVREVWVKVHIDGTSNGDLAAVLYATDGGGNPTGPTLATGTLSYVGITDVPDQWHRIALDPHVVIPGATSYAVVLGSAATEGEWRWRYDSTGAYASGEKRTNTGGGWTTQAGEDFEFVIFGHAPNVTKYVTKIVYGTLQPLGSIAKYISGRVFSGSITPSGVAAPAKQATRAFTGTIGQAGTIVRAMLAGKTGTLAPSGTVPKNVSSTLAGTAGLAGAPTKDIQAPKAGSVAPSGVLVNLASFVRTLAGAIASAGAIVKDARKSTSGTADSAGSVSRATFKTLDGSVTPTSTGRFIGALFISLQSTIASAGALARATARALAGTVTQEGTVLATTAKAASGEVAPTGTAAKAVDAALVGSTQPDGHPSKDVAKALDGALEPAGAIDMLKVLLLALSGAIAAAGSVVKDVFLRRAGTGPSSGAVAKDVAARRGGVIAPLGAVARAIRKGLYGILQPIGDLALADPVKKYALDGLIDLAGAVRKLVMLRRGGTIGSSATIVKDAAAVRAGAVAPHGTLAKATSKLLVGVLAPHPRRWVERVIRWCAYLLVRADSGTVVAVPDEASVAAAPDVAVVVVDPDHAAVVATPDVAVVVVPECDDEPPAVNVVKLNLGGSLSPAGQLT